MLTGRHPSPEKANGSESSKWDQLERRESHLWRRTLWIIALLSVWGAITSWDRLKDINFDLRGIPGGVLVLMALFVVYVWRKRMEIHEMRSFIRGMRGRGDEPPSARQVEQLFEIVA